MNACVAFHMTVLKGYFIAAACEYLEIKSPDSDITNGPDLKTTTITERKTFIHNLAEKVLDKCGIIEEAILLKNVDSTNDGVFSYARVLCHMS